MSKVELVLVLVLASAAGCGSSSTRPGPTGEPPSGDPCAAEQPKLDRLYRAEATAREPARVEQATADNVAMVLAECKTDPARVAPCVRGAADVATIESRCLAALDEEGSEGDRFGATNP